MQLNLILPEIYLSLTALLVLIAELFISEESKKMLGVIAVGGCIVTVNQLFTMYNVKQIAFYQLFVMDPFSTLVKMIILIITTLIIVLSIDYYRINIARKGEYYCLMLLSVVGMMFMVSANDFLSFFLSLQLTSIPLYILSGFDKNDAKSNEAAYKYLMIGLLASVIMLFGMSLVYGFTASTQFQKVADGLRYLDFAKQSGLLMAILFIMAGFAFKIAAVPFHFWVPDTYEGAPTPVTTFLATAPKLAGLIALIRFLTIALQPLMNQWRILFTILSIVSMFVGNIVALSQTNIKRMLGFSSIAHIGYILMAFAVADSSFYSTVIFYLIIYSIINVGAFAVVAAVSRGDYQIKRMARKCKEYPLMSFAIAVFFISMIGIPPSPGFWGKLYIFASAIREGMIWLAAIGIINSVISVYYYINVLRQIYADEISSEGEIVTSETTVGEIPGLIKFVVIVSLALTVIIAIYPQPFIEIAKSATIMILKI